VRNPIAFWCAFALAAFSSLGAAEDFGWRGPDGKFEPDTEFRKSSQGFGGLLLTTSDPDWEAKWNTPEHETPSYKEATTVRRGETVYTLIFLVNPKIDGKGQVNVRCDLKVTRPNGSVSIDEKNVECLGGALPGNPLNMRLAAPVLGFIGEATDPIGTWQVDVTLRDVPRGVTMSLHTSFELLGSGSATRAK
jgi:hypothetical protein